MAPSKPDQTPINTCRPQLHPSKMASKPETCETWINQGASGSSRHTPRHRRQQSAAAAVCSSRLQCMQSHSHWPPRDRGLISGLPPPMQELHAAGPWALTCPCGEASLSEPASGMLVIPPLPPLPPLPCRLPGAGVRKLEGGDRARGDVRCIRRCARGLLAPRWDSRCCLRGHSTPCQSGSQRLGCQQCRHPSAWTRAAGADAGQPMLPALQQPHLAQQEREPRHSEAKVLR